MRPLDGGHESKEHPLLLNPEGHPDHAVIAVRDPGTDKAPDDEGAVPTLFCDGTTAKRGPLMSYVFSSPSAEGGLEGNFLFAAEGLWDAWRREAGL